MAIVQVYGSEALGLGVPGSDLDINIIGVHTMEQLPMPSGVLSE